MLRHARVTSEDELRSYQVKKTDMFF